jgi:signal transduction histidine kinase
MKTQGLKIMLSENLSCSAPHYAGFLESAPAVPHRLALIDSEGNIVAVNKEWMTLAEQTDTTPNRVGPGANYLEVCRQASVTCADASTALRGIQAVLKQTALSFGMDYRCNFSTAPAWFHMAVIPVTYREARIVIVHTEVTAPRVSNEKNLKLMQQFALRLINAQEEERQRIAQEVHDDLGNRIALIAIGLRQIAKESPGLSRYELNKIFDQMTDFSTALRDLSHGLHPSLLRHLGIEAALKSLHESFRRTHSIKMDLTVVGKVPRLPDGVALCIFRVAQECLHNVARHSRAASVTVVLELKSSRLQLTVSDTGRGFIPSEAIRKGGLGLLSMESRALHVGGRLMVKSSPGTGTEVSLTVPLRAGVSTIMVQ